jgi:hypothetical protein
LNTPTMKSHKSTIFTRSPSFIWSILSIACTATCINLAQAEVSISQSQMDDLTSAERLSYNDSERLTTHNRVRRSSRIAPCVYSHTRVPIYNLAPNEFKVISRYSTRCSRGTHSISVNTRVSGRGWLVAYVYKRENNQWVQVSGGTSSASYYGTVGEYQLIALNRDPNEAATGEAKISYPLF